MKKPKNVVTMECLSAMFEMLLEVVLVPPELAKEFEDFDRRYRKGASIAFWKRRRKELKRDVDNVILSVLLQSSSVRPSQMLRRIPNETLVYYLDRLETVRFALRELVRHHHRVIERPASWREFWLDALLRKAASIF